MESIYTFDPSADSWNFADAIYYRRVLDFQHLHELTINQHSNADIDKVLADITEKYELDLLWDSRTFNRREIEGLDLPLDVRIEGTAISRDKQICIKYTIWTQRDDLGNRWNLSVSSPFPDRAQEVAKAVLGSLPAITRDDPAVIPMKFWSMGRQGPSSRTRNIEVPYWNDIQINYPPHVSVTLDRLMEVRTPEDRGKLLLFYGAPGCGKTYTIRALARAWAPWCNTHYVVDPEVFFGEADYMLSVLLDQHNTEPNYPSDSTNVLHGDERWMLIIIEDAQEFLTTDAHKRKGQSLARLLNVADGLIGQGTKVLLLITTNEKIDELHPAVAREGRCLSNLEFPNFEVKEAQYWLRYHEMDQNIAAKPMSLAELYAKRHEEQQIKTVTQATRHGIYL